MNRLGRVAIIMGSQSDLPTMQEAASVLEKYSVSYDLKIVSAHRTAEGMVQFAQTAHEKYVLIIAGAGGSAHLPGMVAAITPLPVIGVPIATKNLHGIDSLLSIVQMPKGVPVATVAIGGGENAGLLAIKILSVAKPQLLQKLLQHKRQQQNLVKEMNQNLKLKLRSKLRRKSL